MIKDLIHEENALDAEQVVDIVLPKIITQTSGNNPVFKYLSQTNEEDIAPNLARYIHNVRVKGIDFWITKSMRKYQAGKINPANLEEVFEVNDMTTVKGTQQALQDLAFVPTTHLDLDSFRIFLVQVWEEHDPIRDRSKSTLTTCFRKAVRIYDWLKYDNKKTPKVPKDAEAD